MWRKGDPCTLLQIVVTVTCKLLCIGAATVEISLAISQKSENRITILTQKFHSWVYTWKKNLSKRYMHPNVRSIMIYNCQDMEAT